MTCDAVRVAVDTGNVDALRDLLRANPALVTALVSAPDIQATSPLTYVGMVRFYGYARHELTGTLARVLMDGGATRMTRPKMAPRCTALPATVTPT
jgi:hypothetical protein